MIEAWFSSSEMTASSAPRSVSNRPPLASKHERVEDRVLRAEELAEIAASSSLCGSCVPQMNRTEASP